MEYIFNGIREAFEIIFTLDKDFVIIVFVSVQISIISTILAMVIGIPFGVFIAFNVFPGRNAIITILNTLFSLPTVVVGLIAYSFLSHSGPLGSLGLLFTPAAIIFGQVILIFPIVSALTLSAMRSQDKRVRPTVIAMGADRYQTLRKILHEARYGIMAGIIAAFGRVFAEVGISMMLGGNIKGYTRTITTAIALETSKGEFSLGIALGIILLFVALTINIIFSQFQKKIARNDELNEYI